METLLIAEIGINHNGNIGLAHEMLDAAADAGANVVKFQLHLPNKEMIHNIGDYVPIFKNLYSHIEGLCLNHDEFIQLKNHSADKKVKFLVTPFSVEAVDDLEKIGVEFYKIGSGEADDFLLLNRICETNKPILISTGMSTWDEVSNTVDFLSKKHVRFTLLQCTSEYPADYSTINLRTMQEYASCFNCPVGISDHSISIYPSLAAVAMGASVVEKHFTVDKTLPGTDQSASIEPQELKKLSIAIDIIEQSIGSIRKHEINNDMKSVFKHGLVTKRNIKKGELFTLLNVTSKRPLVGIASKDYQAILGKLATKDIDVDHPIFSNYVSNYNEK